MRLLSLPMSPVQRCAARRQTTDTTAENNEFKAQLRSVEWKLHENFDEAQMRHDASSTSLPPGRDHYAVHAPLRHPHRRETLAQIFHPSLNPVLHAQHIHWLIGRARISLSQRSATGHAHPAWRTMSSCCITIENIKQKEHISEVLRDLP
ncbi:hypothetical protein OBBRIDRAFT_413400 [Obba rivulosa]|uniref:Uncharacterized protein n=1 Tax=Obba rivulosa TaxID=1052685 RepID=A0A8E2ALW3_9APHY|nr:hypothetical protein OBBRIDRAFT_413400 [Obba rivulosa]